MNKFISISENEYNSLNLEIIWNSLSNINQFTTQGIYNIYGERIRYSDNLPTNDINSTFSARLTVLDSSTNNREDVSNKHITLILSLSNRLGNDLVYIRTGRGSSLDTLLWESWATLQKNINVGLIKSLDGLVNNGIYSGIFNLDNNHYLSFVCMVINDYSIKQSPKRIVQFMYGLDNNNGDTVFKYRVKTDNIWDNWHLVNESDILNVVNTEVNKILDGTSPEKIQNIKNLITWIEEHGPNSSEIITQIQDNQEQISIEKQRALEAEEDLINRIKGVSYNSNAKTDPFVYLFAGNAKDLKLLLGSTTDSGRYRINFGDIIHIDLNVWKKNNGNVIQCIKGFTDLYEDTIDVSEEYNVFLRKGTLLNDVLDWDNWVCVEGSNIQIKLEAEIDRAQKAEQENTQKIEILNGTGQGSVHLAIKEEITKLIDGAPETLDTFKEIAEYIAEDGATAAEIIKNVAANADAIAEEITRANQADTELLKRIQGKSENSSAKDDPFKFLGNYDSFDQLVEELDKMHGTTSSATNDFNGHLRAKVDSKLVEIFNEVQGYNTDVWSQRITCSGIVLRNEVLRTEERYSQYSDDVTHKYRLHRYKQKFVSSGGVDFDQKGGVKTFCRRHYLTGDSQSTWTPWYDVENSYVQSLNYGKKIALFGGSFAQNMAVNSSDYKFTYEGTSYNLVDYIAEKLGAVAFDDYAVGGQGMRCDENSPFPVHIMNQLKTAQSKDIYDIYIIMGGVNDYWGDKVPLGDSTGYSADNKNASEEQKISYCGGMRAAIDYIRVHAPNAKIYTITPFKGYNAEWGWNPRTKTRNAYGNTFYEFVQAQKEVAQVVSVPCLDLWVLQGFSGANVLLNYLSDLLHPNGNGYYNVSEKFLEFIAYGIGNEVVDVQALVSPKISAETARATGAEKEISQNAIAVDGMTCSTTTDNMSLEFTSLDGESSDSVTIPAATTDKAGVMSAEDKTSIEILKYPLFDLEIEKVYKKFYDSGYLTSFIDVKLGFNYDGSKYFVYFGNGLIKNQAVNPNGSIHLYKDGSNLLPLIPVESSPNEARIFNSTDGYHTIILDITKLDPTYDFSLSVNSGVNLSSKCFGFTDRADIKLLEDDVDFLHKSVSEIQGNEQILFPYVTPSPFYNGETSSIQRYGHLSRQFIKELYIYDKSKIQNEDITSVFVNLIARNNSQYGWLIWMNGVNKEGASSQSFIQAKTGDKNFDESTEIIELVYNTANGSSPCGYIVVDWSFIEEGVDLNNVFKWNLTEHCSDIVYSPTIKAYLDNENIKASIDETISEVNENLDSINEELNLTKETLVQDSVVTQYVNAAGALVNSTGYGSYAYNIEGVFGKFKIAAGVSNNTVVSICRVDDANGNRITKYPLITTNISNTQFINIQEKDNAKTLYVSVTMSNGMTTNPGVVVVENSSLINLENDIEDIQGDLENLSDKIVVFDKKRITESDKVIDSSIENPLKCYSTSANNFGTNNAYNYWYTLFKLPAHTRCVPFERKNTKSTNVALVVKVDSLDQFRLNGSYTRLVAGGDADTSSYGTDEVYQHKPIEFDEDTYIAVLSESETNYTNLCYLEFWTVIDTTLTDINNRVLELESVGVEKPRPYEIVIPDKVYAVVGDTLQIFYDSVFNVQNLANYQVQVLSDKGKAYPRYFEYSPTSSDVGEATLIFNLCEVTDCTTGVTNIIASKEVNLITVSALTDNISANILCVGDSTTAGGAWCKELARRFYSTDGTPTGIGASNINICGRKTGTVSNKTYGWEGTGGWTWGSYVSSPVDAIRFYVKDVTSLTMGANYVGSNGAIYEITEINVTNGVGNVRCMYSWDTPNKNEIPDNGTLTKRYSTATGDNTITYTAFESEKFSPFYVNGGVDFTDYANRYCNGRIDVIVVHLGINSLFGLKTNLSSTINGIINTAKTFINKFHEQFPNGKVVLLTPPLCSVTGGMAANYNATLTACEEVYNRQMYQYHKAYFDLANDSAYNGWVYIANTNGEFDVPFGYPTTSKPVNNRVTTITERIGTNGVHPDTNGYNMIADSVFRTLNGIL